MLKIILFRNSGVLAANRASMFLGLMMVAILSIVGSTTTHSEPAGVTGADLQSDCGGANTSMGFNYCLGFIVGIASSFNCERPSMDDLRWKPSEGLNAAQLRKVFVHWLENHPQYLHLRREYLVAAALSEAFPCP
jgi:hypothetical protein